MTYVQLSFIAIRVHNLGKYGGLKGCGGDWFDRHARRSWVDGGVPGVPEDQVGQQQKHKQRGEEEVWTMAWVCSSL